MFWTVNDCVDWYQEWVGKETPHGPCWLWPCVCVDFSNTSLGRSLLNWQTQQASIFITATLYIYPSLSVSPLSLSLSLKHTHTHSPWYPFCSSSATHSLRCFCTSSSSSSSLISPLSLFVPSALFHFSLSLSGFLDHKPSTWFIPGAVILCRVSYPLLGPRSSKQVNTGRKCYLGYPRK